MYRGGYICLLALENLDIPPEMEIWATLGFCLHISDLDTQLGAQWQQSFEALPGGSRGVPGPGEIRYPFIMAPNRRKSQNSSNGTRILIRYPNYLHLQQSLRTEEGWSLGDSDVTRVLFSIDPLTCRTSRLSVGAGEPTEGGGKINKPIKDALSQPRRCRGGEGAPVKQLVGGCIAEGGRGEGGGGAGGTLLQTGGADAAELRRYSGFMVRIRSRRDGEQKRSQRVG